jgi:hypothetical protein
MSDTTVIEQEPETAPAEPAAQLPADASIGTTPASSDSWDEVQALLDDFDAKTAAADLPPEPTADNANGPDASSDELDKLLADLTGPSPDQQRIGELTGEIDRLRQVELERQSVRDFEGFSRALQDQLGPNLPADYAKTSLLAMATEDPNLQAAWKYRSLTPEQIAAADKEFRELEALHFRAMQAPDDPRKQQAIAMLEARGRELGLAMNAKAIIMNARRAVQKRAESFRPIDEDATELRADIAFQMKQGKGPAVIPEERPNFGVMTDRDFQAYTRKHYGF